MSFSGATVTTGYRGASAALGSPGAATRPATPVDPSLRNARRVGITPPSRRSAFYPQPRDVAVYSSRENPSMPMPMTEFETLAASKPAGTSLAEILGVENVYWSGSLVDYIY